MKKTGISLLMGAALLALTACGGGGSSDFDDSALSVNLNPSSDVIMVAGSSLDVTMNSTIRRTSATDTKTISSMSWNVTSLTGGLTTPLVANAACVDSSVANGTGVCRTTVLVPETLSSGEWTVSGVAKGSNGTQTSSSFKVTVNNNYFTVNAGNAQSVKPNSGVYDSVLLAGVLTGANGAKRITYAWTQVSGPVVNLSNASSATASFVPTGTATYVFNFTVTIDGVSRTETTTVVANP